MNAREKELCPVCGMHIQAADFTMEYHKLFYHFCSAQCRETFQSRPGLYIGKQAQKIGEIIKHRRLHLAQPMDRQATDKLTQLLKGLMGVKEVHVQDRVLMVRYDLLQLNLAQLEAILAKSDITLARGWWQRLRRVWINNSEQNELDNLAAPAAACCSRPPPRV
jgi:YHS domain-containing protein